MLAPQAEERVILSIDPGLRTCGAALWNANVLVWAALVKNPVDAHPLNPTYLPSLWNGMRDALQNAVEQEDRIANVDRLVIELPQVYVRTRSKGDPNDLIQLAGLVGKLTETFNAVTFLYKPAEWKAQVPKKISEARTKAKLHDSELAAIQKAPAGELHNVFDAIGLGLFHLGR